MKFSRIRFFSVTASRLRFFWIRFLKVTFWRIYISNPRSKKVCRKLEELGGPWKYKRVIRNR